MKAANETNRRGFVFYARDMILILVNRVDLISGGQNTEIKTCQSIGLFAF
jgi:hypothetical protein